MHMSRGNHVMEVLAIRCPIDLRILCPPLQHPGHSGGRTPVGLGRCVAEGTKGYQADYSPGFHSVNEIGL